MIFSGSIRNTIQIHSLLFPVIFSIINRLAKKTLPGSLRLCLFIQWIIAFSAEKVDIPAPLPFLLDNPS